MDILEDNGYVFKKILGSGVYGEVKLYEKKNTKYAIKRVGGKFDTLGIQHYNELDILRRFDHPNLMKCFEFLIDNEYLYLVLPYYKNELTKYYRKNKDFNDIKTQIRWMYELTSALHYLHKNEYSHCDIKPENILLSDDFTLVLSDYSTTYISEIDKKGCTTITFSSPQAIKQTWNNNKLDKEFSKFTNQKMDRELTDIWSLGVIFCYFVTKELLFGENAATVIVKIKEFMKDREKYLTSFLKSHNVEKQMKKKNEYQLFYQLLLKLLQPDQTKRIHTTDEIFTDEFFKLHVYNIPVEGKVTNYVPYKIKSKKEIYDCICYIFMITDYFKQMKNFRLHTIILAIELIYRCYDKLIIKNKKKIHYVISYLCFKIAASIMDEDVEFTITIAQLFEIENKKDLETLKLNNIFDLNIIQDVQLSLTVEKDILTVLDGIILTETLYNYCFSKKSAIVSLCIMLNIDKYEKIIKKGVDDFPLEIENTETVEEKEHREPRNIKFEELFKMLRGQK